MLISGAKHTFVSNYYLYKTAKDSSRHCCLFIKSSPPTLHPLWGWLSSSVIWKCQAPAFPDIFAGRITIMRQQRECVSTYIVLLEKTYNLLKKKVMQQWSPSSSISVPKCFGSLEMLLGSVAAILQLKWNIKEKET